MSVQRFRAASPDAAYLQTVIEAGLAVSSSSGAWEVDVTLVDDNLLPDLQAEMQQLGFAFVATAPADPRVSTEEGALEWKGGAPPPLSGAGDARIYFDSTSKQLMLSQDGGAYVPITGAGSAASAVHSDVYTCPLTVNVRDAVYLSGADSVDKADSDDNTKQPLIGIVVSKPTTTSCVVAYYGEVTGFVGLTAGVTYYLGTVPGSITDTAPTTSGNIVQRIGFARNATTLVVMVDRDWTEIT